MTMEDEYHAVRRRLKKVAGDVLSGMIGSDADDGGGETPMLQVPETLFEFYSDGLLATAFFIAAIIAARR